MAIHSSILAWKIPWTEKPGRLQSLASQGVRHNWVTNTSFHERESITISEAEEWISELEDKMVEITYEEQNKVKKKKMKRTEDNLRDLWDKITCTNIWIIRVPEEEEKMKGYSWKFPQCGKWNIQSSPRGTKSPIQDKPKEKHTKTHTNQTNKD